MQSILDRKYSSTQKLVLKIVLPTHLSQFTHVPLTQKLVLEIELRTQHAINASQTAVLDSELKHKELYFFQVFLLLKEFNAPRCAYAKQAPSYRPSFWNKP